MDPRTVDPQRGYIRIYGGSNTKAGVPDPGTALPGMGTVAPRIIPPSPLPTRSVAPVAGGAPQGSVQAAPQRALLPSDMGAAMGMNPSASTQGMPLEAALAANAGVPLNSVFPGMMPGQTAPPYAGSMGFMPGASGVPPIPGISPLVALSLGMDQYGAGLGRALPPSQSQAAPDEEDMDDSGESDENTPSPAAPPAGPAAPLPPPGSQQGQTTDSTVTQPSELRGYDPSSGDPVRKDPILPENFVGSYPTRQVPNVQAPTRFDATHARELSGLLGSVGMMGLMGGGALGARGIGTAMNTGLGEMNTLDTQRYDEAMNAYNTQIGRANQAYEDQVGQYNAGVKQTADYNRSTAQYNAVEERAYAAQLSARKSYLKDQFGIQTAQQKNAYDLYKTYVNDLANAYRENLSPLGIASLRNSVNNQALELGKMGVSVNSGMTIGELGSTVSTLGADKQAALAKDLKVGEERNTALIQAAQVGASQRLTTTKLNNAEATRLEGMRAASAANVANIDAGARRYGIDTAAATADRDLQAKVDEFNAAHGLTSGSAQSQQYRSLLTQYNQQYSNMKLLQQQSLKADTVQKDNYGNYTGYKTDSGDFVSDQQKSAYLGLQGAFTKSQQDVAATQNRLHALDAGVTKSPVTVPPRSVNPPAGAQGRTQRPSPSTPAAPSSSGTHVVHTGVNVVQTTADYNALPRGTTFTWNGKQYRKP